MSNRIYVPTQSFKDWQRLLAKPDLHWKAGYSAMTLARSWEAADPQGFPPEVSAALATTTDPLLQGLSMLIAIPEYQVALPGGDRSSQTDLLVLARGADGLVAVAVEGKVDEAFGPTVEQKRAENSKGVNTRLHFLTESLGLKEPIPGNIRYQLLHRTVSAMLIAEQFSAKAAVMLVHSFSPTNKWFDDFAVFAALFGLHLQAGSLAAAGIRRNLPLFIGWCSGDQRFRAASKSSEDDVLS
ncbi:MAG: hypothetical protein EA399_00075 [Desulfovibrionales bacterium]|nr:MAG: hypothetical protein EA399_00075 [Desulfovibrionales bacterium]